VDGSSVSVSEYSRDTDRLLLAYISYHTQDEEEVAIVVNKLSLQFKMQCVLLWLQCHCISVFFGHFSYCGSRHFLLTGDFLHAQWQGIFAGLFCSVSLVLIVTSVSLSHC
jgi:hypothetical protein